MTHTLPPRRRAALAALVALVAALLPVAVPLAVQAAPPAPPTAPPHALAQPDCLGDHRPLVVASQMPYARVSVSGQEGYMVLDFGASVSAIAPANFAGTPPQPLDLQPGAPPGAVARYADFVFYGTWGTVQLQVQHAPAIQALRTRDGVATIRQAGVIGTDFLAQHVYTLDYRGGHLWRAARGAFCSDAVLAAAGYRAVSTRDYYGPDPTALTCPHAGAAPRGCASIPTVPVRIGTVTAVAQLDTGYDDSRQPFAVNINAALFDALKAAGVKLAPRPDIAIVLSTCRPGVSERVEAYRLARGTPFGFVDTAGRLLRRGGGGAGGGGADVTLFVKRTPPAAAACGGIGTWAQPAAQLGASFVAGGSLVVDPFSARVWLR